MRLPPMVLFEDEHLLVINKPAGWNTHAPSPYAGEGVYDWLRHRQPEWARLAIVHRLDKETSGVLLFTKTELANRSLTEQFASRLVRKSYVFLTDRPVPPGRFTVRSILVRAGSRYYSRPVVASHAGAVLAETRFECVGSQTDANAVRAQPRTGRTHQIRAQAAAEGFPVLGDVLYGGSPSGRLCLHASELGIRHPSTGEEVGFSAPCDFASDPALTLRGALSASGETSVMRLIHGASDGWPGFYVDRWGDFLLSQSAAPLDARQKLLLQDSITRLGLAGAYHKLLSRQVRQVAPGQACPAHILGAKAPDELVVIENGLRFAVRFTEGYSAGLFPDQRDNRRRLLVNHIAAGFPSRGGQARPSTVLNVFAYTCGFSVCAAKAGSHITSLDLSRKALDWGRRNFELNGLPHRDHEFVYGDAFDWLRRFAKKKRRFDTILLDPPTFSTSKRGGPFRAEADLGVLIQAALPLLKPDGVLFVSTNAARLAPEEFLQCIHTGIARSGRQLARQHYVPQPPDFPISRTEPAYLKTCWLQVTV